MKIVKTNSLKSVIFTAVKNRCILHGRVFVMDIFSSDTGLPIKAKFHVEPHWERGTEVCK